MDEHLFQTRRVGPQPYGSVDRHYMQLNTCRHNPPQSALKLGDEQVQVKWPSAHCLAATESHQSLHQCRCSLSRFLNPCQITMHRMRRFQCNQAQLRISLDHLQQVVEFMGNPTSQTLDGLERPFLEQVIHLLCGLRRHSYAATPSKPLPLGVVHGGGGYFSRPILVSIATAPHERDAGYLLGMATAFGEYLDCRSTLRAHKSFHGLSVYDFRSCTTQRMQQ